MFHCSVVIDRFLFSLIMNALIIQYNIILMIAATLQANEVYIAMHKRSFQSALTVSVSVEFCLHTCCMSSSQPVLILRAQTICTSVICTSATLVASCLVLDFTACAASSCSSWCHRCPQTVLVSCWDSLSHCNHSHAIQAWHTWIKRQLNTSLCSGFVSKCWGWR